MKITTIGIDLAKSVFQVHGVDTQGKAVLKKQVKRDQMVTFFTNLMPCLISMEACGSAHFWARKLQALGHTVRLIGYCQLNENCKKIFQLTWEILTKKRRKIGGRPDVMLLK